MLGELESAVLRIVWHLQSATVSDVRKRLLGARRRVAYTTVMTTMDRLFQKNLLRRELVGKAYRYSPCVSREDFARRWVANLWQSLTNAVGEPAVSFLVAAIREEDFARFEELAREVERARGTQRKRRAPSSRRKP